MKKGPSTLFWAFVITAISFTLHTKGYGQELQASIDSLLSQKYFPETPGATFLISKDGNIVYNKAFGLSNLELNTEMQTDNVFQIGSITKQFTAVAVMMLVEQGKLKLDATISTYIPDYPNGERITIHHLLTHTSGIKDFTRVKGLNNIAKEALTPKALVDFFKNEPMDFPPGEQFQYCNAGYVLLGYLIELASGQSYAEFVEKQIFDPLQMANSSFASHRKLVRNRAYGYSKKEDQYSNNRYISFSIPYASGALLSTVEDMFKWQDGIKRHLLISEASTQKVFTNYDLNNGEKTNYGYGWHIKSLLGSPSYEHGGSIFGFKSMGIYLPREDIYIIALSNCGCNSPTQITRTIAEMAVQHLK